VSTGWCTVGKHSVISSACPFLNLCALCVQLPAGRSHSTLRIPGLLISVTMPWTRIGLHEKWGPVVEKGEDIV